MQTRFGTQLSGRDRFDAIYQSELDMEAEWLRRGAKDKVDSIEYFLSKYHIQPKNLIELGAGTGAVISECQRRKLASHFTAVDFSTQALQYLKNSDHDIDLIQADITSENFRIETKHDVLILSHVLEHLEDPKPFLQAVRERINFEYAIIEVPLEALFLARLKAKVKDRSRNSAGHVQFFTTDTFESLISRSGFEIIDRRNYIPIPSIDTLRLVVRRHQMSTPRFLQMLFTRRLIPLAASTVWARFYYSHHAVLCRPLKR